MGPEFVGAVGCRSSSCHGGAGEKRSQYITWSQKDFHTRGYAILLDARSARIAEAAGIPEAQSSARCTVCHSPFQSVDQSRLAPTAHVDEGVSCESCHNAAGSWLRGHTRPDWTYAMRVSAGMRDLRSLNVRANTCVACHQNVDADLLKAGHPALVFELDSQSVNEPKHWKDDDASIGPRSWLVGQAVALREAAWHSRTDSNSSPDSQQTALALAWLLSKVTLAEPTLPRILEPASSELELLQTQADALARRGTSWNCNEKSKMSILRVLAESDSEFVVTRERPLELLFYRAQRIALAMDRLAVSLGESRLNTDLDALREDIKRHYDFDPGAFAKHLQALRSRL